jgi:hypothetical protein
MLSEKLDTSKLTYTLSKDELEHMFLSEVRELKETAKSKPSENYRSTEPKLF